MAHKRLRDDKLRQELGIYENLMDDMAMLADIFIGNETIEEFTQGGEYEPLLKLMAEIHFSPENKRVYSLILFRIKFIEKKLLEIRGNLERNFQKAKFIYRDR